MWAWGTGVLKSEDAWDTRQAFLERTANGDDASTATSRLVKRFQPEHRAPQSTFWLALSSVQVECGRLCEEARTRALAVIADGTAIAQWESAGASAAELRRHNAALVTLGEELERSTRPVTTEIPRPLTPRKRIQAMMAPYWGKLTPQAQRVAVEVGHPPPRNLEKLRSLLNALPADQAWLVVSQAARTLRWQQALAEEVVVECRERLAQRGISEAILQSGELNAGLEESIRADLLRLAPFEPERTEIAGFLAEIWEIVHDDPRLLRPPSYPKTLLQSSGGLGPRRFI